MAKVVYHRLADAMAELLETRTAREVAATAVEYATHMGKKLDTTRLIPEIERALYERYGHTVVHITTARELSKAITDLAAADLAEALESRTHEVITKIDPAILGGVIAEAAGMQRDRSMRRKLQFIGENHG